MKLLWYGKGLSNPETRNKTKGSYISDNPAKEQRLHNFIIVYRIL